jgi:DNA-binding CsgD family transcriptional regulator
VALLDDAGDIWGIRQVTRAELYVRQGAGAEALACAERIRASDDGDGSRAFASFVEGIAQAKSDERASLAALDRAHQLFLSIEWHLFAARALLERAIILANRKTSRTEAARSAEQARLVFERIGARRWADRARKKLRELGERPPPVRRPGPSGGPLSRRELEIATLFAQGLTTTEVAKRLIISPHTAAAHLQRIYQRLEIHSRVALTRYLVDHGLLT